MSEEYRADWAQKDFYAELGVKKDATADEVKKAYRKLARANHPDSSPGDTAKHDKFKAVAEAYDVVGDPGKRKRYDEFRSSMGSGGFRYSGGGPGFGGAGGGFNLDDLLRDRAGGTPGAGPAAASATCSATSSGRRPAPAVAPGPQGSGRGEHGDDQLRRLLRGGHDRAAADLRLRLHRVQRHRGQARHQAARLPRVRGAGYVVASVGGGFSMNETCPSCGGRQLVYDDPCPVCHGSGRGTSARTIQARIPAGVKDGQRIRLRGKGGAGEGGGPAGDLYVTVKVGPHRVFGRKDDNLTIDVPVSFDELALGAEVKIPTLAGAPVTLKIPAGTPNGRTFRVRGKGARRADGTTGDLLATVNVHVPAHLNEQARSAVEAYRDAMAGAPLRANLFEQAGS